MSKLKEKSLWHFQEVILNYWYPSSIISASSTHLSQTKTSIYGQTSSYIWIISKSVLIYNITTNIHIQFLHNTSFYGLCRLDAYTSNSLPWFLSYLSYMFKFELHFFVSINDYRLLNNQNHNHMRMIVNDTFEHKVIHHVLKPNPRVLRDLHGKTCCRFETMKRRFLLQIALSSWLSVDSPTLGWVSTLQQTRNNGWHWKIEQKEKGELEGIKKGILEIWILIQIDAGSGLWERGHKNYFHRGLSI